MLRKENIAFVKPPECERFVGYEGLLSDSQEAYSNMRQLMERLRGFWEGELPEASKGQVQNGVQLTKPAASPWFRDGKLKIELFTNSGETKAVDLLLNSEELTKVLRTRIEQGVESFLMPCWSTSARINIMRLRRKARALIFSRRQLQQIAHSAGCL